LGKFHRRSLRQNIGEIEWRIFCQTLCAGNFLTDKQRFGEIDPEWFWWWKSSHFHPISEMNRRIWHCALFNFIALLHNNRESTRIYPHCLLLCLLCCVGGARKCVWVRESVCVWVSARKRVCECVCALDIARLCNTGHCSCKWVSPVSLIHFDALIQPYIHILLSLLSLPLYISFPITISLFMPTFQLSIYRKLFI